MGGEEAPGYEQHLAQVSGCLLLRNPPQSACPVQARPPRRNNPGTGQPVAGARSTNSASDRGRGQPTTKAMVQSGQNTALSWPALGLLSTPKEGGGVWGREGGATKWTALPHPSSAPTDDSQARSCSSQAACLPARLPCLARRWQQPAKIQ